VPIRVFYPLTTLDSLNPSSHPLKAHDGIKEREKLYFLTDPLFVDDVSRLFLDIVQGHLEVVIIAAKREAHEPLQTSIEFVDPQELEKAYVTALLSATKELSSAQHTQKEQALRARFREYMQRFCLLSSKGKAFAPKAFVTDDGIVVKGFE
jgi:hypothetical protein